jgi:PEGA domain
MCRAEAGLLSGRPGAAKKSGRPGKGDNVSRATKVLSLATAGCLILIGCLVSAPAIAAQLHFGSGRAPRTYFRGQYGYSFPSYGYGGYGYTPGYGMPAVTPPYPYMPNYWWVGSYPTADPRQSGYNPNGGYAWNDVTTLMLTTYPVKSQVTLDGIMVGQADELGPIELPIGEHTLRVDAPGYEPSETVLKVETPTLQQLAVNLKQINFKSQPAPKP